jgi:CheY-like chemotaxis protein
MDKKTILIVDDDSNIRRVLSFLLERTGCKVYTAIDGVDGLERARELHPDLIVTDAMMPRKDGFELCRELRGDTQFGALKIIMLTARDQAAENDSPVDVGIDLCLMKPFNPIEITRIVKEMLQLQP